jgi:hypothetical protein
MPSLNLSLLKDFYAVCRFPTGTPVAAPSPGSFSLLVQATEETTLVCPLDLAPSEAEIDAGWRCFRIEQSFDFSVPGILASVLTPLARRHRHLRHLHLQHRLRAGEGGRCGEGGRGPKGSRARGKG